MKEKLSTERSEIKKRVGNLSEFLFEKIAEYTKCTDTCVADIVASLTTMLAGIVCDEETTIQEQHLKALDIYMVMTSGINSFWEGHNESVAPISKTSN